MPLFEKYYQTRDLQQIGYQLFLPDQKTNKHFPMIVFLHGSNLRGDDLSKLSAYGLMRYIHQSDEFPFIVLTPQCPENQTWPDQSQNIMDLIQQIVEEHEVDPARIYLTGFSLGASGTWDLAVKFPQFFAAIAPIAGTYNPKLAFKLKATPVWAFHGEQDETVHISGTKAMIESIELAGGKPKYSYFPELGHAVMYPTYDQPELFEWFLSHSL